MTRVMVWNIQFFTQTRIMPTWFDDNGEPQGWSTYAQLQELQQRTRACRDLIEETVAAVDPDVFAVIEARTSQGNVMELADGGGPDGLRTICQTLRGNLNSNWCLVPPLRLNPRDDLALQTYTETVGVFYRADRMQFTGPYVWPGVDATGAPSRTGPPVPPGTAQYAAARYPEPWHYYVPPGTTAAACCRYFKGTQEVVFTEDLNRRPYCTDFTNLRTGHPFRLFTVHFRPDSQAAACLARLLDGNWVPPVWTTPTANQTIVVAGDFNVDLRGHVGRVIPLLRPYPVLVGGHLRFPWPSTIKRLKVATDSAYLKAETYDYGLARWGAAVTPAPLPEFPGLVGDLVLGVPPIAGLGLPPIPGRGLPVVPFNSRMQDSLATIAATPGGAGARDARFRLRANYGRISPPGKGLSDHFPAVMEA